LARLIKKKPELNLRIWVERLKHDDPNRRLHAAMVLGAVGPRARSAVPELADLLVDRHAEIRKTAAVALGEIGPAAAPAVSALTRCVTDCDESVRRRAVTALGEVASDARTSAAALVLALRDDSALVRRCAAAALGALGAAAPAAVPHLIEVLEETDVKNRVIAATALARIGSVGVPLLTAALHHADPGVRRHVVTVLGKIGCDSSLAHVRPMLDDPDEDVCLTAARVLGVDQPRSPFTFPET
jgi:HEAT repeat protein